MRGFTVVEAAAAQWSRTTKNLDCSTGRSHLFFRLLIRLHPSLACSALLALLTHFTHSLTLGKVDDSMAIFFCFFFLFCTIARLWKPAAAFSIRRMNFLFGLAAKHYLQFRAKTKISLATASPTLVHCQGKRPVVMVRRLVTESGFLPVERMQMGRIFTEKRPVTAAEKGAEGI